MRKVEVPLVSLIIPVFNGEQFIAASYSQVVAQTYVNLEVIYVDNGSTDQTTLLVHQLCENDTRVYLHHEKKRGAGAARNLGLKVARGEIVSFMDVDDQISPDKITRHVGLLQQEQEAALVFGQLQKIYARSAKKLLVPSTSLIQPGIQYPIALGLHWMANFGDLINPSAVTCRREEAVAVGGFEEGLQRGEDAAFFIKMALHFPVYFDAAVVATYVRHADSTVSIDNRQMLETPYIKQYKQFYTQYIFQLADKYKSNTLRKWYEQLVIRILLLEGYKQSLNYNDRISLIQGHLLEFLKLGFSSQSIRVCKLISYLPKPLGVWVLRFMKRFVFISSIRLSNPATR